jgi:hypothetical protein
LERGATKWVACSALSARRGASTRYQV